MDKFKVFVTLGNSKFRFDRLLECIAALGEIGDVNVQAGYTPADSDRRVGWKVFDFCTNEEFSSFIEEADIVIAHAGVGVITSCLRAQKRALVMARQARFKEHVNDHQLHFARHYSNEGLFEHFENSEQLSILLTGRAHEIPPAREFITNLDALKKDFHSYVRCIRGL